MKLGKFFGIGCTLQALFVIGIIVIISSVVSNCNKKLEESGKGFIETLGGEIKTVKDEFNKGFTSDTLVIDTIKVKTKQNE